MKISPNAPCPCHSGAKYKKCCRPYHDGTPAPTAEALMRSHYSAYVLNRADYIMQTTDPNGPMWQTDSDAWRAALEGFSRQTRFVGLTILAVDADTVTFHAALFQETRDVSFTEISVFRQRGGRWLFVTALETKSATREQTER